MRLPLFRYLLRKTRNAGTAEDLAQETFFRLCRHLRDERPLDNAKAWLLTVANNLAIDESRADRHQTGLDKSAWKEIEESRSDTQDGLNWFDATPTRNLGSALIVGADGASVLEAQRAVGSIVLST